MKISGSVALVTGAGRGIGKTVALTLGRHGASVILTARTTDELERVKRDIESAGGRAHAIRADLTNAENIQQLFSELHDKFGRLDILVNNAGIASSRRCATWHRVTSTRCGH